MSLIARLIARIALAVALAGSAALVQAAVPISFLYTGHGTLDAAPCGADCLTATISGVADDWAGLASPIPDTWEVLASETVDLATLTFTGSFIFADTGPGANSLLGSMSGTFTPLSATQVRADILLTIEDGTGIFSGATGSGMSTVYADLALGQYVEAGKIDVMVVPEPSTWAMLLAGGLAIGTLSRRRRA